MNIVVNQIFDILQSNKCNINEATNILDEVKNKINEECQVINRYAIKDDWRK